MQEFKTETIQVLDKTSNSIIQKEIKVPVNPINQGNKNPFFCTSPKKPQHNKLPKRSKADKWRTAI